MEVYYSSNVNYYQQEPIFLNHQQQQQEASSSSEHVRNEMVFIPPTTGTTGVVTGLQNLNGTVSSSDQSFHDGQGLSLTLGNQISLPSFHHHQQYHHHQLGFTPNNPSISVKETPPFNLEEEKSKEMMSSLLLLCQSNPSSGYAAGLYNNYRYNETSGGFMMSSVLRSRYLKPAQSLLEEMVSVKKEMRNKKKKGQDFNNDSTKDTESGELSTTELQNKKNKLLAMVDEVDKRYNQYYHQMEALASSFEIVAGFGASKPYTSVALNKISRSFRSLRDTIEEQIQIVREKLGEKGGGELSLDEQQQQQGGGGGERIPRLRYLDQRLRQQRAFHQQIGMVRPSWRPQRGLPENSVSALRAWLFEHFLHPYPKDSEKMMLAKQTGLSKNQVANWFINARVRLWKPMIEDIYKQEFSDESELRISKSSQEPNITNQEDSSSSQQQPEDNNNTAYPSADTANIGFSSDEPKQQEVNRSGDYETLLNNYQGYVMEEDYRYNNIGGNNQQDSRFSNAHHLHDFAV
ncbi:BEL1-like homeodomain protein 10 [Raphanus sativus]|uniref:BEL1-like homeodomain protein 10 n=1 Tax=Raphanus sativus TaxID=3726 RepID=A0A6J0P0Q3_RAPSA|nr:BEL1-like homeodomain protein 10 [Raphanus sativus]XP_056865343.1 BEL1-like homeodomain protein 10 [Raphanus sativus]